MFPYIWSNIDWKFVFQILIGISIGSPIGLYLLKIFETRKKEPIDYRRSGVITLFVGAGLYMLGFIVFGKILEGAGALVGLIGLGQIIAGYLYPNTGKELTNAVEEYEKK